MSKLFLRLLRRACRSWICAGAIPMALAGAHLMQAADAPSHEVSTNSSFVNGLADWHVAGDVEVIASTAHPERKVLRIGPATGSISQQIAIGSENHCMFSAVFEGGLPASAKVTLRFLDKSGKEWMRMESGEDMSVDKDGKTALYFRPHPRTAAIEITLADTGGAKPVVVEQMKLSVYEDNNRKLKSVELLTDLMRPFWQSNKVSQEAVVLFSSHGGPAAGTLLFRPMKILSVTGMDGRVLYKPDTDYTVTGRTIRAAAGSQIPRVDDEKLLHGEIVWNETGGRQVLVTYEHEDAWTGPVQPYVGAGLPETMRKLAANEPIEIVAYGDSIAFGVGSGHMQKLPPYQPSWFDMFTRTLATVYGEKAFSAENAAQSGADSNWARKMAARMVASLHPDLVIVAFGQNDFWSVTPDDFAANIRATIRSVRAVNPGAEFLLISTMRFDPAYSTKPEYWDAVTNYEERLRAMTAPGVQVVDMTAISGALFAAKAPKDCLNDPLHPNDYLSRWYAQSMMAALVPEFGRTGNAAAAMELRANRQ